jgi:starch synthase (maltosyl-transferring)
MLGRIVIENVRPRTLTGRHPAKATAGMPLRITADIFRDGHDHLGARVRWRRAGDKQWTDVAMTSEPNDVWAAEIVPAHVGPHQFAVEAWTDRLDTWRHDVQAKAAAGQQIELELEEGARIVDDAATRVPKNERDAAAAIATAIRNGDFHAADRFDAPPEPVDLTKTATYDLWVDRTRAQVGAWYELVPRSEGGFKGATDRLDDIVRMGFDVVYFPPIHPIGTTFRKGRNNTLGALPDDPGSPWAIGGEDGGHLDVEPTLGTIEDFDRLVRRAHELGVEVALDYALQCSPDHPWVTEHPEWFHHRPDGTIKYAENPPKKYQDIYPINFWPADDGDRQALWDACEEILRYWIGHGVKIFRVDNPHTKPFAFWEWVIDRIHADHPDVLFLAEAFTRPKVMAKLAEIGFTQSYTYFTWRTGRDELREYVEELAHGPLADYMRPNFWPNTPDILSGPLRNGPPSAFALRLVLAATLTPNYGIYSGYERGENQPASDTNEEYLFSEKYEIKHRDWDEDPGVLTPLITRVNAIRRRHRCFDELSNIRFHHTNNADLLAYSKHTPDFRDVVLTIVNLDAVYPQEDTIWVDLGALQIPWDHPFEAHDELSGVTYTWRGGDQYVRLDPAQQPAHVLHLRPLRSA